MSEPTITFTPVEGAERILEGDIVTFGMPPFLHPSGQPIRYIVERNAAGKLVCMAQPEAEE